MKKILSIFILLILHVEAVDFNNIAVNFISYEGENSTILSKEELKKNDEIVGYLYNLSKKGYIIIPNSSFASPIKAFSFTKNYKDLPKAYKEFLINELYEYKVAEKQKNVAKVLDTKISDRWSFLENFVVSDNSRNLKSYIPDTYLLDSSWNQAYPYNKTFPKVGDKLTLAGCVAVAEAQLMRYHAYPSFGNGSSSYLAGIYDVSDTYYFDNLAYTKNLKAVFRRPYNWDIMPSSLDSAEDYQIDEVSYLLRDLVVLNRAKIGLDETGAILNIPGLVEHFGYSRNMREISTSTTSKSEFLSTLKSQIDSLQPVLFSFPSHMVVADGYKSDNSGDYIHLNMGWGGAGNDFYNLDASSISASGTTLSTNTIKMAYNIKPCSTQAGDCYVNLENTDSVVDKSMNGSFENQDDVDKYSFYLSGSTTISTNSGGYYINIYDANDTLFQTILSDYTTGISKTLNLPTGLYKIEISLSDDSSSGYLALEDYNKNYDVSITTEDISESEKLSIEASLKKPTIFDMELKDIVLSSNEKKIRINAYDEDSNLTFNALTTSDITATFDKNILTLKAKNFKSLNDIAIAVSSDDETVQKSFKILTYPQDIKFGKFFSINGTFDSQDDFDTYDVVLEGKCSIYGYNGYSNQAFYTELDGIKEMDDSAIFTPELTRNFYTLGASLSSGYSGYYPYDNTNHKYTLYVECPSASENIDDLIPLLNETISVNDTQNIPTIYTQQINQGWSLVSIPVDTNLSQDEIKSKFANSKVIWTYKDNNWSALGVESSTQTLLQNSNIPTITTLHANDGFWVYTTNSAYDINYTDTTTDLTIEPSAYTWRLFGTTKDINSSGILQNDFIKSIWVYKNDQWLAKSNDTLTQSLYDENNISKIETIKKGEGFWIKSLDDYTLEIPSNSSTSKVPLRYGWNLIGGVDANLSSDADYKDVAYAWSYDNDTWKYWIRDGEKQFDSIKADNGAWVYNTVGDFVQVGSYQTPLANGNFDKVYKSASDSVEDIWNISFKVNVKDISNFAIGIKFLKKSSGATGEIIYAGLNLTGSQISYPKTVYIKGTKGDGTSASVHYDDSYDPDKIRTNSIELSGDILTVKLGSIMSRQTITSEDTFKAVSDYNITIVPENLEIVGGAQKELENLVDFVHTYSGTGVSGDIQIQ
jgi:hypothetical protein